MARPGHPIHNALLDAAAPSPGSVLLDLGCGDGPTLQAASERPGLRLVGVDARIQVLAGARSRLAHVGEVVLVAGDLEDGIPLAAASVDVVVSHNTLECLADPAGLLGEAARVLRPGGVAVWSHIDFDGLIVNTTDKELGRRVVAAFSDHALSWMRHTDGRMGRKLPGLVRASGLDLVDLQVHMTVATELSGDARERVGDIMNTLGPACRRGHDGLTSEDLDRWEADVRALNDAGAFFYAEPTVIAVGRRRGESTY